MDNHVEKQINIKSKSHRRSGFEIVMDILSAIQEEQITHYDELKITRVQNRVFLNWNTFIEYLIKMDGDGLINRERLSLTSNGEQLLQRYRHEFRSILKKYNY